jgi:hypothetical protein
MKSQDILLLLKIISLHADIKDRNLDNDIINVDDDWADWETKGLAPTYTEQTHIESNFSVRSLENYTGISKSQISLSLNRMNDVGLAKPDRRLNIPKVNTKALLEFIAYGIKYVFPAKESQLSRGIATSIAAPVLNGKLMSSGDLPPIWSHSKGNTKGLAIEPLHPNVFHAIQQDGRLYALLALTDAVRIGRPRERNLALDMMEKIFEGVK